MPTMQCSFTLTENTPESEQSIGLDFADWGGFDIWNRLAVPLLNVVLSPRLE